VADQKHTTFERYRKSQTIAGLSTDRGDSLICPLCWQETKFDDLSIEHVLPGSVGGSKTVLTCRQCNNEHGSSLDAHLSQYQKTIDAFRGHGAFSTEVNINGKRMAANLDWATRSFHVVGKATDPRASESVKADFQAGLVGEINVSLSIGYHKDQFDRAVLRAAYLVLFRRLGYEYLVHDVVQVLRRRICDAAQTFPRLGSIILEFRNPRNFPEDEPHVLTGGTINDVQFLLAILRVRKSTVTYLGAFMPHPTAPIEIFCEVMEQCSREYNGQELTIPSDGFIT